MHFLRRCHPRFSELMIDSTSFSVILNYNTIHIYDLIARQMESTQHRFIHSKLFKILVLAVYIYSFIQMDADESPIKVDLVQLDDPFMMKKIQLEVTAPMKILIRIMGKDSSSHDESIDSDHTSSD